jgi:hypothetical protein
MMILLEATEQMHMRSDMRGEFVLMCAQDLEKKIDSLVFKNKKLK